MHSIGNLLKAGVIIGLLLVVLGLLNGRGCGGAEPPATRGGGIHADTVMVADTVIIRDTAIVVQKASARVSARRGAPVAYLDSITHDTVLVAQPFTMRIDTVIQRDTLQVVAEHPPPTISLVIRRAPDSIRVETRTITVTDVQIREPPWYERAGYSALGFVVGGGIGYILGATR